jgi:hypothetical protein
MISNNLTSFSTAGPPEVRVLMTGLHTVADIYCVQCHVVLGWTYIDAVQESEKYKIGKFVLEMTRVKLLDNSA